MSSWLPYVFLRRQHRFIPTRVTAYHESVIPYLSLLSFAPGDVRTEIIRNFRMSFPYSSESSQNDQFPINLMQVLFASSYLPSLTQSFSLLCALCRPSALACSESNHWLAMPYRKKNRCRALNALVSTFSKIKPIVNASSVISGFVVGFAFFFGALNQPLSIHPLQISKTRSFLTSLLSFHATMSYSHVQPVRQQCIASKKIMFVIGWCRAIAFLW